MEETWRGRDVVGGGGARAKKKRRRRRAGGAESGGAAGRGRRAEKEEAMSGKSIEHGGEMVGGNGGADSYLERSSHLSLRPYKRNTRS